MLKILKAAIIWSAAIRIAYRAIGLIVLATQGNPALQASGLPRFIGVLIGEIAACAVAGFIVGAAFYLWKRSDPHPGRGVLPAIVTVVVVSALVIVGELAPLAR